jgi:hypothetical protein
VELSKEVKEDVKLGRTLGHGFFQVICKEEAASQRVLMQTPHLSRWGTCILQPWIPSFNPSKPIGMKMPIWVTLKVVPDEYRSNSMEIAGALGTVIGKHRGNQGNSDQRFCVAITTGQPWQLTISVKNPVTGQDSLIEIDYNNLPIRCRFCLATYHLIKDYHVLYPQKRKKPATSQEKGGTEEKGGT